MGPVGVCQAVPRAFRAVRVTRKRPFTADFPAIVAVPLAWAVNFRPAGALLAAALERCDAALARQQDHGLPRITALETEYLRAVTAAEAHWVRSVTDDLRAGRLTWSAEALTALADALQSDS